jgi:hypothetical protein
MSLSVRLLPSIKNLSLNKMKTSNKFLTGGIIIFFGLLLSYNIALMAEYNKLEFKNEFYSYESLGYKSFDEITVNCGNILDLKIIRSDTFGVKIKKFNDRDFRLEQIGNELIINVTDSLNSPWRSDNKAIVIFCPTIAKLKIKGQAMTYFDYDTLVTNVPSVHDRKTVLEGFNTDSLNITLGTNSKLRLNKNKIQMLNAIVGDEKNRESKLILENDNVINLARFRVAGKSELQLNDPQINTLNYSYSKGATISLTGKAHSLLK